LGLNGVQTGLRGDLEWQHWKTAVMAYFRCQPGIFLEEQKATMETLQLVFETEIEPKTSEILTADDLTAMTDCINY
jgi:hypothetical protein